MTTLIGLVSGKEFVVQERFYPFFHKKTGVQTNVFVSENGHRTITVLADNIEFYDEPLTTEMREMLNSTPEMIAVPEVSDDPNIG